MDLSQDFKAFLALLNKTMVNFIDLENIKRNKQAAGRTQDTLDWENLEIGWQLHNHNFQNYGFYHDHRDLSRLV
jgi:hypothetical protein